MSAKAEELALQIINSPATLGISFGDGFKLKHAIQEAIEQYGRLVQEAAAKCGDQYNNDLCRESEGDYVAEQIQNAIREMPLP